MVFDGDPPSTARIFSKLVVEHLRVWVVHALHHVDLAALQSWCEVATV
jgi:hypothetical protein